MDNLGFILILLGHQVTLSDMGESLEQIINRTPWPGSESQGSLRRQELVRISVVLRTLGKAETQFRLC